MNAGAYNSCIFDVISEVCIIDENKKLKIIKKEDIEYGYRYTSFMKQNIIIVYIVISLNKESKENIKQLMKQYLTIKKQTQPLNEKNAGSTFKNQDNIKAWQIIEELGFKGYNINDAKVSNKHANFLINKNNATFNDMIQLINIIKQKAKKEKNIDLICEWSIIQ